MQSPLEITFHGLQGSPALEVDIRQHVDRLERHCSTIVSCNVTVEASGGRGMPDHHVGVRIRLGLAGRTLEVSHDPHHGKERRAHPDAHSAVQDAFRVAERQVQGLKA